MALSVGSVQNPTLTGVRMSTPQDGLGGSSYDATQILQPASYPSSSTYSQPTYNESYSYSAPAVYYDSYGNSYGTQAAATQANAAVDQQKDVINSALGRLPNQLSIAQANVNDQYGQKYNGLQSGLQTANTNYNQGVTTNQQNQLSNVNKIDQGASSSLHSILRLLGGLGAGGGSEAKYLAPGIVGKQASQQVGGAQQVYGQNARALDTNINNYRNDEKNQELQLNDWKTQQLNSAQSTADTNKQNLLQKLASLQPTVAQSQPYIDQINSLASEVDNLARFSPSFNGTTPVYTAPTLGSYTVNPQAQAQVQNQAQQSGSTTPYLSLLLGQDKKQEQL